MKLQRISPHIVPIVLPQSQAHLINMSHTQWTLLVPIPPIMCNTHAMDTPPPSTASLITAHSAQVIATKAFVQPQLRGLKMAKRCSTPLPDIVLDLNTAVLAILPLIP